MKMFFLALGGSLTLVAGAALADTERRVFSDFNCDGVVDGQDFVIFAEAFRGLDPEVGDFDGDGVTSGTDFVVFGQDYRASMGIPDFPPFPPAASVSAASAGVVGSENLAIPLEPTPAGAALSIPEPSTVAVLGVGLLCCRLNRRASR